MPFEPPALKKKFEDIDSLPARYDDLLEVTAYVKEQRGVRISIACEVRRQGEEKILVSGFTTHCFVSTATFRPIPPPEALLEMIGSEETTK